MLWLGGELAVWMCSERCTAEHCGSVISHFSLSLVLFLFLSANNGTAMHQHPQAKHREVRDCIMHAWNNIQDLMWKKKTVPKYY